MKLSKIKIICCVLALLSMVFTVKIIEQEIKIYETNKEIEATKIRIVELEEKQKQLNRERASANDPAFIEKVAREDYNMVKKGEVPVLMRE